MVCFFFICESEILTAIDDFSIQNNPQKYLVIRFKCGLLGYLGKDIHKYFFIKLDSKKLQWTKIYAQLKCLKISAIYHQNYNYIFLFVSKKHCLKI